MMSERKAELERKRARLQAIRADKERHRREKEQKEVKQATAAVQEARSSPTLHDQRQHEVDSLLSNLGMAPISDVYSSLTSVSSAPDQSTNSTPDASLVSHSPSHDVKPSPRKVNLTSVTVQATSIQPKEIVTYSKQTQTASSGSEPRDGRGLDYYVLTYDDLQGEEEEGSLGHLDLPQSLHSKLPPGILPHGMPQVQDVKPAMTDVEQMAQSQEEAKPKPKEFSEEEKQVIMISEDFVKFIDTSSRSVERALYEDVDIFVDYAHGADHDDAGEDKFGTNISLNRNFYDERWSKNRCVTCLDWSPQYPELLAASYTNNEDAPHDPDGVVLVWNTKFKKTTPEYIFHCQSRVMATTFARFHPNLILGGTYSGQVVLWDNRVQKRMPIQRSPLSASSHTHPVYCMHVVGTQNAHNLISVSTDGKLCSWSLDMLSQPQESMELQQKQSKAVAVTCLSFPYGDVNNFIVGSEEGSVFSACRHGSKAGITDWYEGHAAPVTGIDTHMALGQVDLSHLFLTSSFDWTVKLWSLKERQPLYSFEYNGDYVYDVAWSPIHPALFACVDGTGKLDIWNLNQDTEVPTASTIVDGSPALNQVSWTQSGLHVTVGDDMGKIWVYDIGEQLALPKTDEWTHFLRTLQELKDNQADDEHDKRASGQPSTGTSVLSSSPLSSSPLR